MIAVFGPGSTNPRFAPVGKDFDDVTTFSKAFSDVILPQLAYLDLTNCTSAAQENEILWFVQIRACSFSICFGMFQCQFLGGGLVLSLDLGACGWHWWHTRPCHFRESFSSTIDLKMAV